MSSRAILARRVARKSALNPSEAGPSRSSKPSSRNVVVHRPTVTVYTVPAFSKFLTGCTLYRFLRDYWNKNGMPFLQRTLLYERAALPCFRPRKRKLRQTSPDRRPAKRPKVIRFSDLAIKKEPLDNVHGPKVSNVEWKPFSTKVVFESVHDRSGAVGTTDVEVGLIRAEELEDLEAHISRENVVAAPFASTLRLPRNPPSNGTTNGHVSPSITIPVSTSFLSLLNGAQQSSGDSAQVWILFRCKLPLPRASRRGLRDSAQRRASASLTPMKSDYCYGCLEIGDETATGCENGCEITVFMKRLPAQPREGSENGNGLVTNGRPVVDIGHMLRELLADTDDNIEEAMIENMPTMKLRVSQTCIQQQRHRYADLSPSRIKGLRFRSARIEALVDFLPFVHPEARRSSPSSSDPGSDEENGGNGASGNGRAQSRVFYQFNFEYQQTSGASAMEAWLSRVMTKLNDTRRCPFCDQRCSDLYALLQHYRCCHARWSFVIKENADGVVIETRPTQYYDGRLETRVCRRRVSKRKPCPVKKTYLDTKMLFYRPARKRYSAVGRKVIARNLDEFKTCPKDIDSQDAKNRAEFMLHHVRRYYHSQTCQPLLEDEFDKDSEDEMDPEWLRDRTERLIDEFTDVNEGEKSIMKIWNLHVMKYNYFGDGQMVVACDTFLSKHGRRVVLENLTNNFLLHLANLYYFGLLSQAQMARLTKRLHSITDMVRGRSSDH